MATENLIFIDSTLQMPLMALPVRSVAIQLEKACVLISPGSKLTVEQLQSLPTVTDVVAPSLLHGGGVALSSQVFPKARLWGPAKIKGAKPQVPWTNDLAEGWMFENELPAITLQGMPQVEETLFIHKDSKTLIATDLCFNLQNPSGWGAGIILRMFGTYRRFGVSRFFTRNIKDRDAFQDSLGKLFSYDFDKIVMSHGDQVDSGGRELLLRSLAERDLRPI